MIRIDMILRTGGEVSITAYTSEEVLKLAREIYDSLPAELWQSLRP